MNVVRQSELVADRLSREYGDFVAEIDDRLAWAQWLQIALTRWIGGATLKAITEAKVAESVGMAPEEIYGLAHADRNYQFSHSKVRRVLRAAGYKVSHGELHHA